MKAVRKIRLSGYDYSANGYYFVTIVTDRRQPFLREPLRSRVERAFLEIAQHTGVSLDYSVFTDNHIHFIMVLQDCSLKLGELVRRFKAKTSRVAGFRLWQPNYYEHVIRNERALRKIREYIENNPLVELLKFNKFYSEDIPAPTKRPAGG